MKINVFSQLAIEKFKTNENHIVISIRSPGTSKALLPKQASRIKSLYLEFHDIDERCLEITDRVDCDVCKGTGFIPEYRHIENGRCFKCNKEGLNLQLFSRKDAINILDFVKAHSSSVDLIAVNCEAGISRSAGVAAALGRIFNSDDFYYFKHYLPNSLVRKLILQEYYDKE